MIPRVIRQEVEKEYDRATSKFPPFNSAHEGFAILLEEVEELKAEVFKNHYKRSGENMDGLRREATQTAAMAIRFLNDCALMEER